MTSEQPNDRYIIDGVECVRVSHVLEVRFPYTGPTNLPTSARDLGIGLHSDIENYFDEMPLAPREEMVGFFNFLEDNPNFEIVQWETVVSAVEYRVAGRIDALFEDRETGEYVLVDWKRIKRLWPSNREKYYHQQNLYMSMLPKSIGRIVSRGKLVLIHPDIWADRGYSVVDVPQRDIDGLLRIGLNLANERFG